MDEEKRVHAPYNFVPFSDQLIVRYGSMEQLPAHNRIDPELKTGEIYVALRADTPVFVSDGREDPHFFRGPDGTYQIPGSTVRGMVRDNMQILGFGQVRPGEDLEDVQIYFRDVASGKTSVKGELKDYYKKILNIQSRNNGKRTVTTPLNVRGGYLYREGNTYSIQPARGDVLRVFPDTKGIERVKRGKARSVPVSYMRKNRRVTEISSANTPNMDQGVLLYAGKSEPYNLYLFPSMDQEAVAIPIEKEDILSYQVDLERRKNTLGSEENLRMWALPEQGEYKAVFYVPKNEHSDHVYFGCSRFVRIGYRHSLSHGLPKAHWTKEGEHARVLDYPSAILGFAEKECAYRSRVSFGDFRLVPGSGKELPLMQAILLEPKPSYYPGYVEEGKHYNNDDFKLRGCKQYWLKEPEVPTVPEKSKKVASKLRPLDKGSEFRGVIRFKNLTEDELGLLLWALRLEKGCYQTIGMGKPYGYGRMSVTISSLRFLNPKELYTPQGFCGALQGQKDTADVVNRYINAYDAYAAKRLGLRPSKGRASLRDRSEIKDFLFMKSAIRFADEVSYMDLTEYQGVNKILETVAAVRRDVEKQQEPPTEESLAALREKYSRKL